MTPCNLPEGDCSVDAQPGVDKRVLDRGVACEAGAVPQAPRQHLQGGKGRRPCIRMTKPEFQTIHRRLGREEAAVHDAPVLGKREPWKADTGLCRANSRE